MTTTTVAASRGGVSPYLLLTLTPFFWSCNWIIGRGLHEDVPPLAMTFYRWLFAILILAPFALPHVRRDWPEIRRNAKALIPLGIVGIGSHNALAYIGLNYTTATNGVILNSFIPIMIITLSFLFLRERLTRVQALGVAISLGGVATILSHGSWQELVGFRLNHGDVFVMLSMLLWSLYTIGLRWRPPARSFLSFLFVIAVIGDLAILPLYLAETALVRPMTWSWASVAALVGVALFSSVLAYIFWNRGVAQVGANVAGLFVHLMPVFGVLLAWLILGERLLPYHVAGIALILTGIWLTTRRARAAVAVAGTD
jgi:drug/metabolite transporter (DMT)-like permease